MTEISGAELTIDLGAVQANYRTLQSHLAGAELAAVVKADAYGLGLGPVVRALTETGCETFFVATAAEAVQLRGSESDANIHVFNGPLPGEEAAFLEHALVPVLNSLEQVQNWSAYCTGIGAPGLADIQIDTGMSRLGLEAGDVARLAGSPELLQSITLDLASAGSPPLTYYFVGYDQTRDVLITLDHTNDRALVHDLTGAYIGASQLPIGTPVNYFGGYANGQLFIKGPLGVDSHGFDIFTPEPATISLMCIGAVAILRRRNNA